eukprot:9732868-Alexandrium_andersonii.AAC.1
MKRVLGARQVAHARAHLEHAQGTPYRRSAGHGGRKSRVGSLLQLVRSAHEALRVAVLAATTCAPRATCS